LTEGYAIFYKKERQKVKQLLFNFKNYVGSTEKDGGWKVYEPSFICTQLRFIAFPAVTILWHLTVLFH
jgi:hypothetical protein